MRVDVHAHYYDATYVDRLARNGADTCPAVRAPGAGVTFDQRVGLLDGAGIRLQVLSVGALQPYFANAGEATAAARLSNDLYADICQRYSGRSRPSPRCRYRILMLPWRNLRARSRSSVWSG